MMANLESLVAEAQTIVEEAVARMEREIGRELEDDEYEALVDDVLSELDDEEQPELFRYAAKKKWNEKDHPRETAPPEHAGEFAEKQGSGSQSSQSKEAESSFINWDNTAPKEKEKAANESLGEIPVFLHALTKNHGVSFGMADKVTTYFPNMKEKKVGMQTSKRDGSQTYKETRSSYAEVGGIYNYSRKAIVIGADSYESMDAIKHVVKHEYGHAVDDSLGKWSNSDEFKAAYQKDVKYGLLRSSMIRKQYLYFLQANGRGESEAFAESFAQIFNRSDGKKIYRSLRTVFPNVFSAIKTKLRSLESGAR